MPGNGPKKRKSPRRPSPRRSAPARPVLGNDPFERGAAVRLTANEPGPTSPIATAAPSPAGGEAVPPRASPVAAVPAVPPALADRLVDLEARAGSAAARATARLRELAHAQASGEESFDLAETVKRLVPALKERLPGLAAWRALLAGSGDLDAFGMERELVERAMPLFEFLYSAWWRVEVREPEEVPAEGPVMLVANHGGTLPWDALVLRLALLRDHAAHRELRPLLDQAALRMPVIGALAVRLGAVPATPEHAGRLLADGLAVAVFPEGSANALRPWPQRYRIERFGRGGFAKLALRAGAPIVPCAIVGSEETSAPFARSGWLSARLGMPLLLSVPALPIGALNAFPLPSRWSVRFGEAIDTRAIGPAGADVPAIVEELTEKTRTKLQAMLDGDVAARRSAYL
jgi:1-acyl-sn-glycerol-3-phosphate acyltransferase